MLKVNGSGETPLDRCQGSEVEQLIRKIAAGGGYSNAFVIPVHLSMLKKSGFSLPKHLIRMKFYPGNTTFLITPNRFPAWSWYLLPESKAHY